MTLSLGLAALTVLDTAPMQHVAWLKSTASTPSVSV